MSKTSLKIVRSSDPERCEVYHQSDMFDPVKVIYYRCDKEKSQTNVTHIMGIKKHIISDHIRCANDKLVENHKKRSFYGLLLDNAIKCELLEANIMLLRSFNNYWKAGLEDQFNIPRSKLDELTIEAKIDLIMRLPKYSPVKLLKNAYTVIITIVLMMFGGIVLAFAFLFYLLKRDRSECIKILLPFLMPAVTFFVGFMELR